MEEQRIDRIPAPPGRAVRWTVTAAAVLLAAGAQAQTPACEQLKTSLAARLPAAGSYHLESLPAGEPVPKGAKVIGNCSGGAYRMLFIRGAPPATAAPTPKPVPVEKVVAVAPAPAPAVPPPKKIEVPPPPPPAPAPAPVAVVTPPPKPEPKPEPEPEPRPIVKPAPEPETDTAQLMPMPPLADEGPSFVDEAAGFAADHWPWLSALVAVPLLLWGWGWVAHRRAYDAAGLPRGPRIRA
ncbi:DUF1161 domain-containing protein [Piscinibacter gummiphilus]|uniref:Uncharacterized protein n=1 Tax=Piscinibacter gummiphilus TaxID=946333 RepID=A0A1W6LGB9_9BURK|nr:DUF1161 domain-containing protein [Piscinibacter gummiphilus]ARN23321.1 hypothetical protein A4W93_27335 [Piscinibacter gummiphilus]GLS97316.1 hypothetical protein GCM10007918_46080 [Piscinibacter gummiphilus]